MLASEVGARLGTLAARRAHADIWYAWVGDHAGDVRRLSAALLSNEEQAHLDGYRSSAAAERYVVTRALVRLLLGERLALSPRDVPVTRTDFGKPVVNEEVHFNISHSGELVVVALSDERPVGVDVERRRAISRVRALIARWLTPTEQAELDQFVMDGHELSDAFLRVWSLKEARLKALGVGISRALSAPLETVDVVPLDALLDRLPARYDGTTYVGALAFG